ncbi:MAG: hypothetical protein F6K55_03370 [Moorea sp. SIO4A3]|nr:hypothetical protein [Moorena sp. SIO4A3]
MNVIVEELPRSYRRGDEQQEIAEALTAGLAMVAEGWLEDIENYEQRYLNPKTCNPDWLDYLAVSLGWSGIWDANWPISAKRELLANTTYIWANRGTRSLLLYLFDVFGLDARFTASQGWIVGDPERSKVPISLLLDPFAYTLIINHLKDSKEYRLVKFLVSVFVPCWIQVITE